MMKLYKKLYLLIIAAIFTLAAKGQQTIFSPANVSSITSSAPFVYGSTSGLIDGSTGDFNGPNTPSGPLLVTFKLTQPAEMSGYDIYFYDLQFYGCDNVSVSGSNDGKNYTLLNSQSTSSASSTSDLSANFSNSTAYAYYQFSFSGYSNNFGLLLIDEIQPYSNVLTTAPVLATTTRAGSKVSLSWNPVIHGTGSYEVDRSVNGTDFTIIQSVNTPQTSYDDIIPDTTATYWYKVRATNDAYNSPYSNVIKVTDQLLTAPTLTALPGPVGTQVKLSWTPLSIAPPGTFELSRSTDGTNFTLLKTFDKSVNAYTDSTVKQTTPYWYKIRAIDYKGGSPYSSIVKVTTVSDAFTNTPVLTAVAPSGTEAQLSWTFTPNTPTSYSFELDQSTDGTHFTQFGKFAGTVNAYAVESLTPNTTYWFRIKAYNYTSQSPYSTIVKVTTGINAGIPADITDDGGKLYVSNNSDGSDPGEGESNFIDNSLNTKWLVFSANDPSGQLAAIYKPTGSYVVTSYAIGTANDSPPRDPGSWTFAASNDSTTWVTLDTRSNQLGGTTPRSTIFNYTIANPGTVAYKFYRILFTANNGATDGVAYQVSEWEIFGINTSTPKIPTALNVTGVTSSDISLAWNEATPPAVSSFTLQRSLDAVNYTTIASGLSVSPLTYTDKNLLNDTTYHYRVQALGTTAGAITGWSNVATGKTAATPGLPSIPSNLLVTAVSDSTISLQWHDRSNNETGFRIERSTDGTTFAPVTTVAANDTTYTDQSLWSATKYYYQVFATNATGSSSSSNIVNAVTTGSNEPPMAANPLIPRNICGGVGDYTFTFGTIVPGPNNEASQTLHVTSITADSTSFFSAFKLTPELNNGTVTYGFTTSGKAMPGDSCNVLVTVKDNGGTASFGADSAVFAIKIHFVPLTVSIAADQPTTNTPRYQLINLTASSNAPENTTYTWSGPDGIEGAVNLLVLKVRPTKTTTYTVTGITPQGCQATAQITISPIAGTTVANVLTPNGDGVNDTWIIWGLDKMPNNNVQVFDMSGRLVFNKKNYANDWGGTYNGALLPQGAYYYVVDPGNGDKPQKGMLNIIR